MSFTFFSLFQIGDSEEAAANAESICIQQGIDYYRFSPHLEEATSLGETDSRKLVDMVVFGNRSPDIRALIQRLISKLQVCSIANQKMSRRLRKNK